MANRERFVRNANPTKVRMHRKKDDIGLVDATMSGLNMLDLFSGIGGFHEGFKRAGYQFDWVGFSEIDKYASAVYRYKYRESEELNDIKLIRPGKDTPDYIDILCGGFPCQSFSMAGKRTIDDTRGTLFFEIARLLSFYRKKQRPIRCLVLENVKGLLNHDDGRTFATIFRVLNNLGYTIEFQLLNSRNFSIPQSRQRVFIVGYIGTGRGPQVFPIKQSANNADKSQTETSRNEQRLRPDYPQIARTISARYYKDGSENLLLHDKEIKYGETHTNVRRLTPVECNRLQGFSDDHNKYGIIDDKVVEISDTQRYKQAGNAVTVDVVQAIARTIQEKEII